MTVAGLLAAYGLRVIVIERRSGTSDEPKAISLDDESLRVYQQSGIVDQVMGIIVPGTGTKYYDANNEPLFQARDLYPTALAFRSRIRSRSRIWSGSWHKVSRTTKTFRCCSTPKSCHCIRTIGGPRWKPLATMVR